MSARDTRLAKLEISAGTPLSERAQAWLGLRPPLSPEEEVAQAKVGTADLSRLSPRAREWLSRRVDFNQNQSS